MFKFSIYHVFILLIAIAAYAEWHRYDVDGTMGTILTATVWTVLAIYLIIGTLTLRFGTSLSQNIFELKRPEHESTLKFIKKQAASGQPFRRNAIRNSTFVSLSLISLTLLVPLTKSGNNIGTVMVILSTAFTYTGFTRIIDVYAIMITEFRNRKKNVNI